MESVTGKTPSAERRTCIVTCSKDLRVRQDTDFLHRACTHCVQARKLVYGRPEQVLRCQRKKNTVPLHQPRAALPESALPGPPCELPYARKASSC